MPYPRKARRRLGAAVAGTASVLVVAGSVVMIPSAAQATLATGGAGAYRSDIEWMTWGADGAAVPADGETKTDVFSIGGRTAELTCTISDVSGAMDTYTPGTWTGDALDDLYDIGGTGGANTLVNGLVNRTDGTEVTFDLSCSATVDGKALPLGGLVFADAEQSRSNEWIAATAPTGATWRIIDRYRDPACTASTDAKLVGQTLTLGGTQSVCASGPSAVAFIDGGSTATDVTLHGGGRTAIAVGAVLSVDRSTLPASYGEAAHLEQPAWRGGDDISATGTAISEDAFGLATPVPRGPLLDAASGGSPITLPSTLTTYPGATVTVPVARSGAEGVTRGWIDWNGNGEFDPDEASAAVTSGAGTASLRFTVPADVRAGSAPMLVRVASDADDVADPTGMASDGALASTATTIALVAPTAAPDAVSTAQNTPVAITPATNDTASAIDGATIDPASVRIVGADGALVDELTTDDASYRVDTTTGTVTATPASGSTGALAPVEYSVADSTGQRTTSTITVTVDAVAPGLVPDTATTDQGRPLTVDVLGNDRAGNTATPLDATTLGLVDGDSVVSSLTVPGQGSYTVADGRIRFTPELRFVGAATPVHYSVADVDGSRADSTLTVTVDAVTPVAVADEIATGQGDAVTVDVLDNDRAGNATVPLDPATLTLLDGTRAAQSVAAPGQGTFTIVDGAVRFAPEHAFVGTSTVSYRVLDANGTAAQSTLSVHVTAVVPVAQADTATTDQGAVVTMPVLDNDEAGAADKPLDTDSLTLVDASGADVDTLVVPGEGTWSTTDDHELRFAPEVGFTGTTEAATYAVRDVLGTRVTASARVDVVAAELELTADHVEGPHGAPVTAMPLDNDRAVRGGALDAGSLALEVSDLDPVGADRVLSDEGHVLTVDGEGTWTVEADGAVTFEPLDTFSGTAAVTYSVANVNGVRAMSAITAEIGAPVVAPVVPPAPAPAPAELAFTGATFPAISAGAAGLLLALGGLAMVLIRRRRA